MAEEYDDPYDDESDSLETETPTLDQVIWNAIQARLLDVHTALPAKVVKVRNNGFVDIQPLLQRRYTDGSVNPLPIIPNVPINHPRGANYYIKLPVAVGDTGIALFSERSLDAWLSQGGLVDPDDPRTHDLSDAIFIAGMYPQNNIIPGNPADLVLKNGKAMMKIQPGGTFTNENGTNELYDLLTQTVNQLITLSDSLNHDTTNTIFGPTQLNNFVTYGTVKSALTTILGKLNTLKGS